ncbi:MAG TPA: DUF4097 family beta strand repeat-containing protein [Methylomirabilota bacterium]|nr:DUF4097 family beta strand repeat-containing protein [Methylomirabilota bacterium]
MATYVRSQEIEQDIGEAGAFSLRVTSPDVELRAVEGTTARVQVEFEVRASTEAEADELFERIRFRVRAADGSLDVSEPKDGGSGIGAIGRMLGLGTARVETRVNADIPRGASIVYAGVSADLMATGFTGSQEYRTVSGDLVLHDLASDVRVRGVSSDVSLRADAPLRLEANTVSGDISAFAPRFERARIVTVSGDIELEGDLAAGGEHRVETLSGDLSLGAVGGLTLEVRGLSTDVDVSVAHRSEGSRDRRRYVIGDGAANLLFSSMSGDVSVRSARRGIPPPPAPPAPPTPLGEDEQINVLRALERGEIDVEEATRRLAGGDHA